MPDPDWTKLFGSIDAAPHADSVQSPTPAPKPGPAPPKDPTPSSAPREISPGVFDMAASFAGSMAQFAAGGFRQVSKEVYERRQAVCQACEQYSHGSCLACGCYILPKISMPHEQCPLGKWKAEG